MNNSRNSQQDLINDYQKIYDVINDKHTHDLKSRHIKICISYLKSKTYLYISELPLLLQLLHLITTNNPKIYNEIYKLHSQPYKIFRNNEIMKYTSMIVQLYQQLYAYNSSKYIEMILNLLQPDKHIDYIYIHLALIETKLIYSKSFYYTLGSNIHQLLPFLTLITSYLSLHNPRSPVKLGLTEEGPAGLTEPEGCSNLMFVIIHHLYQFNITPYDVNKNKNFNATENIEQILDLYITWASWPKKKKKKKKKEGESASGEALGEESASEDLSYLIQENMIYNFYKPILQYHQTHIQIINELLALFILLLKFSKFQFLFYQSQILHFMLDQILQANYSFNNKDITQQLQNIQLIWIIIYKNMLHNPVAGCLIFKFRHKIKQSFFSIFEFSGF